MSIWRNKCKALPVLWIYSSYCQMVLGGLALVHPKQMYCFLVNQVKQVPFEGHIFYGPRTLCTRILVKYFTEENFCWHLCLQCVTAAHTGKLKMKEEWAVLQAMQMCILMSPSLLILFKVRHWIVTVHLQILCVVVMAFKNKGILSLYNRVNYPILFFHEKYMLPVKHSPS